MLLICQATAVAGCRPIFGGHIQERYRVGVRGSHGTDCQNPNHTGGAEVFHRITLIGFVGQPPQMRYTEEGTPVTNFSVATLSWPKTPIRQTIR
jgi:hypothetical protein